MLTCRLAEPSVIITDNIHSFFGLTFNFVANVTIGRRTQSLVVNINWQTSDLLCPKPCFVYISNLLMALKGRVTEVKKYQLNFR